MADLESNKVFAKVTKATKLSTSYKCNDDPSFQLGHKLKAYHSMYSVLQGAIVPFRLHSSRKQTRPFKNRQVLDQLLWLRRLLKTLVARRSRGQRGIRGNPFRGTNRLDKGQFSLQAMSDRNEAACPNIELTPQSIYISTNGHVQTYKKAGL